MAKRFPRAKEDIVVLSREVYDDLATAAEYAYGLSVSAPLFLFETPGGPLIGLRQTAGRPVNVKVGTTIAAGCYNATLSDGTGVILGTSAITEAQLGSFATAAVAIDPESAGLAAALPLSDLLTIGWIVGTTGAGLPIVIIPPPGVRDMRFNTTTHKFQVAFVSSPTEAQWVDKVTATPCP